MARHKCFISFKFSDNEYREKIQNNSNIEMIDKSLRDPIHSNDVEYIMRTIRDNYLKDSSVTIFLIGRNSSENEGFDKQQYIKRELQASLYKSDNNERNGILGVVLPEMYDTVFGGEYLCQSCNKYHNLVRIDDRTVIKEFSANYYIDDGNYRCSWSESERYCVLVKWDDFMSNPNTYIEKAWNKITDEISKSIRVRPK